MDSENESIIALRAVLNAVSDSSQPRTRYAYGTAGFRGKYTPAMHLLFVQIGVIAALRSLHLNGQCVGVMVTASHNEECDNGVKIVDFDGGMLEKSWERRAESLVNDDQEGFLRSISELLSSAPPSISAVIMIAMDTRSHSSPLVDFVCQGIRAVVGARCQIHQLGEAITPVIHFAVKSFNAKHHLPQLSNSEFDHVVYMNYYFQTLHQGYRTVLETKGAANDAKSYKLILDTAFGVGSITVNQFLDYLRTSDQSLAPWTIFLRNQAREGPVNSGCGAEHVQKLRIPPVGVSAAAAAAEDAGSLLCSFDGDGDRIVFHYFDDAGQWVLLDGDRIAALVAVFIYHALRDAELLSGVTMGIVQTAYANGSSTAFLRRLNVPIVMAKTGVKYLHHKAQQLDVGVYFEANGHGTVVFSDKFQALLAAAKPQDGNAVAATAIIRLKACLQLINPTVGDALSDLLCVLAILHLQDMDGAAWNDMYTELPSHQVKMAVNDKNSLICSEDETFLLSPPELQEAINAAAGKVSNGRCFVRPSGTEDVVRIYVEASSDAEVEQVIAEVREVMVAMKT